MEDAGLEPTGVNVVEGISDALTSVNGTVATGFLEFRAAIVGSDFAGVKGRDGGTAFTEFIAGFISNDWKLMELTEVKGDDVMEASFPAGDRDGFKSENDDAEASDPDEYELRSRVKAMFLGISRLYGNKQKQNGLNTF